MDSHTDLGIVASSTLRLAFLLLQNSSRYHLSCGKLVVVYYPFMCHILNQLQVRWELFCLNTSAVLSSCTLLYCSSLFFSSAVEPFSILGICERDNPSFISDSNPCNSSLLPFAHAKQQLRGHHLHSYYMVVLFISPKNVEGTCLNKHVLLLGWVGSSLLCFSRFPFCGTVFHMYQCIISYHHVHNSLFIPLPFPSATQQVPCYLLSLSPAPIPRAAKLIFIIGLNPIKLCPSFDAGCTW